MVKSQPYSFGPMQAIHTSYICPTKRKNTLASAVQLLIINRNLLSTQVKLVRTASVPHEGVHQDSFHQT